MRFNGFEDEWKVIKINYIVNIKAGGDLEKNKLLKDGKYPVIGNTLKNNGIIGYTNTFKIEAPAVTVTGRGEIGKAFYQPKPFTPVVRLLALVPKSKNIDMKFLSNEIENLNFFSESTGVPQLTAPELGTYKVGLTECSEQQKIGNFFAKLDKLLDLQQQKIDKLELLKKALLQKLFPKHDAKIPEFRFKGFEDEWEPKYLGKLGFFESGNGFPKNEQGKKIGIPFFKVSDLGSSFKLTKAKNYVAPEQIKSNKWKVIDPTKNGAIVFAKIGAAIFLNRKRLVMKPFLIDNNLMAYVISENVNRNFVMANIQMINFSKFVQVGAIPSINSGDLKKIKIIQPINLSEQQKIGNLLSKVDQLIELENKKLQNFQQVKKCLLQNMFVE